MTFKETSIFTRQITKLLPDAVYREFQQELIFNPTAGNVIKGSGGYAKSAGAQRQKVSAEESGLYITGTPARGKFTCYWRMARTRKGISQPKSSRS